MIRPAREKRAARGRDRSAARLHRRHPPHHRRLPLRRRRGNDHEGRADRPRAATLLGVGARDAAPAGARASSLLSPQGRRFTQERRDRIRRARAPGARVRALQGRGRAREPSTWSTRSCRSATSCSRAASPRRCAWSTRSLGCCRAWSARFDSVEGDSFHSGLLDAPYYTRPAEYHGWKVPDVLLSGNHAAIARRRRERVAARTLSAGDRTCSRAESSTPQSAEHLDRLRSRASDSRRRR